MIRYPTRYAVEGTMFKRPRACPMPARPTLPIGPISPPARTVGVQAFGGTVHQGTQRWRRGCFAHVLPLRLRLEAGATQVMSTCFTLRGSRFSLPKYLAVSCSDSGKFSGCDLMLFRVRKANFA